MEPREIEKLMMAMRRYGTQTLKLERDGIKLELEREVESKGALDSEKAQHAMTPEMLALLQTKYTMPHHESFHRPHVLPTASVHTHEGAEASSSVEGVEVITSPMVGTFYMSSSPDAPPFVQVGDVIDVSKVVCIVEAMKVMNEIKAGVSGTVLEVLVENGQPVEFGTKLFRVSSK